MTDFENARPPKGETGRIRPVYLSVSPDSTTQRLSVLQIWRAVWQGKWIVMAAAVIAAIASMAYSLTVTPTFRSEVVLAPVAAQNSGIRTSTLSSLAGLAGISLTGNSNGPRPIALLRSKQFAEAFINDKNLLPVLFSEQWDTEQNDWKSSDVTERPDIRDAVELFVENVTTVTEDTQADLVTLSIEWTDPETAAQWATELVERINQTTRQRDIEDLQRKLDFLDEQLARANLVELRQAISRVIEEQINAMMLAQVESEYAFTVIDPAIVPKYRASPRRKVIVVIGTIMGGFVGMLFIFGRLAVQRVIAEDEA